MNNIKIVFLEDEDGNQVIYFAKAIVKFEPNSPEFNQIIFESKEIFKKHKELKDIE